jgi:hypothetical protein
LHCQPAHKARRIDSEKAFHKAEVETKKASTELNADLEKARDKTRHALNQPDEPRQ